MSDSTPARTKPASGTTRPSRDADNLGMGGTSPWWVVSLALHALVLLAIVWFTPLREIILNPERDMSYDTTASPDRIDEVVAEIRDIQADMLAWQVEELLDIEDSLEELRDGKLEDYEQFVGEMSQTGPEEALKAQNEALAAQQQALAEQTKAQQAVEAALAAQTETTRAQEREEADQALESMERARQSQDRARDAHARARETQLAADAAQTRADQLLTMLGGALADAREAQKRATAAQTHAAGTEIDAENSQAGARDKQSQAYSRQSGVPARAAKVAEAKPKVAPLQAEAQKLTAEAEKAKQKSTETTRAAMEAKTALSRASRSLGRAKTDAEKKKVRDEIAAAQKEADRLKKLTDQAKAEAKRIEAKARDARTRAKRAQQELSKGESALAKARTDARRAQAEAAEMQKPAVEAAKKATEAQAKAIEAQKKARDALAKRIAEGIQLAAADARSRAHAADEPRPNLFDKDLAAVYEQAVQAETKNTTAYKEIRAADLAIIRKIPLAQAREQTDVARPIRPELNKELLRGSVRDMETAARHKQEVEKAIREVESMVTLGRRLLELAQGGEGKGAEGADVSMDWYRAKAAQEQEMTNAALEDDGQRAKDLSGLMKEAAGDGSQDGAASGAQAAAAAANGGKPGRAGKPGGRPGWSGPPVIRKDVKAIPGRKVLAGGQRSKWMYVDSWYVLGPFPNPRRINRDKKFPPESVVDLDAKYVGKDGKVIRWEFLQSPGPMIVPSDPEEYAIYYAYTELWFEKPTDMWIAVGSDDKSSLWIEDQPVWVSGNQLKSWQIAEGMRRVHFHKGLNRILYRIENGWKQVAWSLVLHTEPRGPGS